MNHRYRIAVPALLALGSLLRLAPTSAQQPSPPTTVTAASDLKFALEEVALQLEQKTACHADQIFPMAVRVNSSAFASQ